LEETIGHPPQEPSAGGADRSLFSRRAVLKQAEHAAGGAWTSGAETRKRQCGSGVPEIATKARLTLSPRADSALCVWQRVAMLWVSGSFWRFSRLAAVACGPVAAGDLAACDGDGRCWGGMVAPDGVAAGGKPVIDGGMAGAAAGSPLADAGVPAPGGLAGRADLDFAVGQVRWCVQDQRAGVCADLQHDSAGLGGPVVFIGHVRTFPRRSGRRWGAGMVIGPSAG